MKVVLQSESSECGLACLTMVADHHGLRYDLSSLRRQFSVSIKGANAAQLIGYTNKLNLTARALRLDLEEMAELRLPCVLHWNFNHFVVLERVGRRGFVIVDPAVGRRTVKRDEVSRRFTGIALEFSPSPAFVPKVHARRVRISDMFRRVVGLKRAIFNIFVIALAIELVALLTPQVTQWVVDGALVSSDRDLLLLAALGGSLLIVVDFLLRMACGWMGLRLNQQLSLQWASNLFSHMLSLPWTFFEKRQLGDIITRFQSLDAIRNVLTNRALGIVLDGAMAVATLSLMLLYNKPLSAIVLAALALYVLLRLAFYFPLRNASEERIVLEARESSYFLESVRAALPLKLFNAAPNRVSAWKNHVSDVQNRDIKTQKLQLMFASANTLIFGIEGMLLLYFGGLAVLEGNLSLGMLLAFLAYKSQFTYRASSLVDLGIELRMLSLHAERLADIALEQPEQLSFSETDLERITPRIEFRNVSFRYAEGEPWVLRELSLTVEAGESVALVGHSGSGKTTLFKLMIGLLSPTEGDILVGGIPIRQLGLHNLRNLVGAVMQEDQLLAGSLAENIAFFSPDVDQQRVEEAARQANIHRAIISMPMGYQTMVAEAGSGLSGGQRQRLLLARALYKRPMILALDEATSHLDLHNESHIIETLRAMKVTRITIAHRRETVSVASRILCLSQGTIVEDTRPPGAPHPAPEPAGAGGAPPTHTLGALATQ